MRPSGASVGDGAIDDVAAITVDLVSAGGQQSAGGVPSRERKPCSGWPGRCGANPRPPPATVRRARDSTRAADSPPAPPPMITTSYLLMPKGWSAWALSDPGTLPFLGNGSQMSLVEDTSAAAIAAALDQVGAAPQRIRTQRRMTLTEWPSRPVSRRAPCRGSRPDSGDPPSNCSSPCPTPTGCRWTTSSRAPEEGDPRLRLKPGQVKGRTVIPLTRQPDAMQAWKIIIPTSKVKPEPRAHDGTSGSTSCPGTCASSSATRTGFSAPGEVAAFDTKVPHWFGSTGDEPAEILSIFGRPGERMTVRTGP